MSEWIKCTRHDSKNPIYVNRTRATRVMRRDEFSTAVSFAGSPDDSVLIEEQPEWFLMAKPLS